MHDKQAAEMALDDINKALDTCGVIMRTLIAAKYNAYEICNGLMMALEFCKQTEPQSYATSAALIDLHLELRKAKKEMENERPKPSA